MINLWIIYGYIWKNDDKLKLLFDVRLQSFWSSKCPLWAVSTKSSPDTCWSLSIWQLSPGGQFGNLLQKTFHTREGEFVGVSPIWAIGCVDWMALDGYMHAEGVVFSRACTLGNPMKPELVYFPTKKTPNFASPGFWQRQMNPYKSHPSCVLPLDFADHGHLIFRAGRQ